MKARVGWSPLAIQRAAQAARHIAEKDTSAAYRWAEGLFDAVKPLGSFPLRGRIVPEVHRAEIRELIYHSHRVVYRFSPGQVEILTVRHARRRLDLAELEADE